jgi:hypothetical protein
MALLSRSIRLVGLIRSESRERGTGLYRTMALARSHSESENLGRGRPRISIGSPAGPTVSAGPSKTSFNPGLGLEEETSCSGCRPSQD